VLCGSGFAAYGLAITGTVLAINVGLRLVAHWIDVRRQAAPDAEAVYRLQVVCVEQRDAAIARNVILRHVNGRHGLKVQAVSSQAGLEAGCEVVAADVLAERANDKEMAEVLNRLSIEAGVRSVRWEKVAAGGA
jgi:putative Mg2+ transporter-C (MgtC) family protein